MPFYGDISEGLPVQLRAAVESGNSGLPSIRACFPNSIPPPNSSYNNSNQNAYQEQTDFQMFKPQSRSTLLSESSREHQSLSPLHSNGYLQHPTTVGTTNERMVGGLATSVINTVSGGRIYASKVFTQCMDRYPSTGTSYDQQREMVDGGGSCWGSLFQNVSSPSTIHTSCSPTMYTNNPHTSQYNVGTSETSDSGVNNMSNWTSYQKDFPPKTQQQLPHNYNRLKNTSTILREGNTTSSSSPTQNVKFSYDQEYTELLPKSHSTKLINKSANSSLTQNKIENSKSQELHAHRDLKSRLKEAVLSKQRQLEEQNEKQYQQQMQQIKQQVQQFNQQVQQHYRLQRMSFSNSATHDSATDANIGSNTQVPYDEKPQVGQSTSHVKNSITASNFEVSNRQTTENIKNLGWSHEDIHKRANSFMNQVSTQDNNLCSINPACDDFLSNSDKGSNSTSGNEISPKKVDNTMYLSGRNHIKEEKYSDHLFMNYSSTNAATKPSSSSVSPVLQHYQHKVVGVNIQQAKNNDQSCLDWCVPLKTHEQHNSSSLLNENDHNHSGHIKKEPLKSPTKRLKKCTPPNLTKSLQEWWVGGISNLNGTKKLEEPVLDCSRPISKSIKTSGETMTIRKPAINFNRSNLYNTNEGNVSFSNFTAFPKSYSPQHQFDWNTCNSKKREKPSVTKSKSKKLSQNQFVENVNAQNHDVRQTILSKKFNKPVLNHAKQIFFSSNERQVKHNYKFSGEGGPLTLGRVPGPWCCRQGGTDTPTTQHLGDGCYHGIQTEDEQDDEQTSDGSPDECIKKLRDDIEMLKNNVKPEIPHCDCFPSEAYASEPGLYYTHLGAAASISDLRSDLEMRTGVTKNALRIEKIVYTGKEGSTVQGCPLAKWIIRRESYDEKILCVVKHRKGHKCSTAWIVVVIVAWEGVSSNQADDVYNMLVHKLNRYGLPNTRRCATNKPRTCACQGLDPNTCGASFTFGCSWSMYYNSCKYVRSKTVRKFRLSVISEEEEIEDRLQDLATMLTPLYKTLAPQSFKYQTQFEQEASDCRLGLKPGRPFSGVTACVDFCAHSHRDFNNMNNGCTVVVTLTKHRALSKPEDEQLHVLPLYVMDETDEFGSKEGQEAKAKSGSIESLTKFPCEVRVRSVPLLSCKRQGKKRKDEANERKEHAMTQQGLKGTVQSVAVSTPTNRTTGIALAYSTKSSSLAFGNTAPEDENWSNHLPMANSNAEKHPYTSSHKGRTSQSDSHLIHHHNSLNEHVHHEQNSIHQRDFNGKDSENKVKKMCGPMFSNQEININSDKIYENYAQAGLESTSGLSSLTKLPQSFESTNTTEVFNNSAQDIGIVSEIFDSGEQVRPVSVSSARDNMVRSPSNSYIFPQHLSMWPNQQDPLQTQQQEGSNYMYDSDKNMSFREQKNCTSNIGDQNNSPNTFYSIQSEVPLSPSSLKHSQNPAQSNFEAISRQDFKSNTTNSLSYVDSPLYYSPISSQQLTPISNSSPSLNSSTQDCLTELQCPSNTHNSLRSHPTNISNATHCQGTSGQSSITSDTSTFSSFPITPTDLSMSSRSSHGGWVTPKKLHSLQSSSPYNSENAQWSPYMHTQVDPHSQSPTNLYSDSTKNKIDKSPSLGSVNTENGAHFSSNTIGEVTDYIDNEESFKNLHIGGVAIALGHGSVLFECAKHELHATTALKRPNRLEPTRISLVFYQHRNLNRPKHGGYEWEEKMRLKKLGITSFPPTDKVSSPSKKVNIVSGTRSCDKVLSVPKGLPPTFSCPTYPTTTWTTLFPMHPCILVGPYQLEDAKV